MENIFKKKDNCSYCGNKMEAKNRNKKYCSNKCRVYANRLKTECDVVVTNPTPKSFDGERIQNMLIDEYIPKGKSEMPIKMDGEKAIDFRIRMAEWEESGKR